MKKLKNCIHYERMRKYFIQIFWNENVLNLPITYLPTCNTNNFSLKKYKIYIKLKFLEGFIGNLVSNLKKAPNRFEAGAKFETCCYY